MFPNSKSGFINTDHTKQEEWYWGINNDKKSHCYILEMVMDSLNLEGMKSYSRFIKKNITNLCLEVGNMSDFFEQLNYIIHTDRSKTSKINEIMGLRDHLGATFIDKPIADLIYNAMSMSYIGEGIKKKHRGGGGEKTELNEKCYRKVSKGKMGYNVKKCSSNDPNTCDNKAPGCKKANCSREDPNNPGYYKNISDMRPDLYKKYGNHSTKSTDVLEGRCMDEENKPKFKLSKFNDQCDLHDLNELCNYYESNQEQIGPYLNSKLNNYESIGNTSCRQMMGEFNKKIKGNSRKKHCNAVSKDLERKQKKLPMIDEQEDTYDTSIDQHYDENTCYRQISKGITGYSSKKCTNSDPRSCNNKATGCKKNNCTIEDPNNPGYYQNISDMRHDLYKKYGDPSSKTTSVLKGTCMDKNLKQNFKLSTFNDQCDLEYLDELCNHYSNNPSSVEPYLMEKINEYDGSGRPICRQMMGEFNKNLKGKTMKKHCKEVHKDIQRKQKNLPMKYKPELEQTSGDDMDRPYDSALDGTPDDDSDDSDDYSEDDNELNQQQIRNSKHTSKKGTMFNHMSGLREKANNRINNDRDGNVNENIRHISGNLNNLDQSQVLDGIETGLKSLGDKLGNQLCNFNNKSNNQSNTAIDKLRNSYGDNKGKSSLSNLPKIIFPAIFYEFNIPLNINDVLLIGFSVFPYIGWVFDIFMIFRALLERRWLYAILMVINWYQWFFWKVLTFGIANVDIGPLLKLFYLGPYASKYFNFSNVTSTFIHFVSELTGSMPNMISITN